MSAGRRLDTRQGQARTCLFPGAGPLSSGAAILLLAGVLYACGSALSAAPGAGGGRILALPAPTIDPRLIARPRVITQSAMVGNLCAGLTVSPVLPGFNHFALRLVERGRPVVAARVRLSACMIVMAMRHEALAMREGRGGRYTAGCLLSMFGQWQLTIHIDRPGAASLTRRFTLGVNLPAGLVAAHGALGAPQQLRYHKGGPG